MFVQEAASKAEVPEKGESRWGSRTLKALLSSLGRGRGQVRHGHKLPEGFTSAAGPRAASVTAVSASHTWFGQRGR